jgi:hypothetical protein
MSEKQRAVELDSSWKDLISPIRDAARKATNTVNEKYSGTHLSIGDLKNGELNGNGMSFFKTRDSFLLHAVILLMGTV